MYSDGLPGITLLVLIFSLSACHDPYGDTYYDRTYLAAGEAQYINYAFHPYETYRLELTSYTGDAEEKEKVDE